MCNPPLSRYLSILFLNILTLLACTHSVDNLFHTLMVLWEKENFLTSNLLCFFTSVKLCPLVVLLCLSSTSKTNTQVKSHGMGNSIINWMEQWLTDRRQRVVVDGEVFSWKSVLSGVPQGSVLGPILFLVYMEGVTGNIMN